MSASKWDYLDDEYEDLDGFEKMQKSQTPEGSMTDNARFWEPKRNGAKNRAVRLAREFKQKYLEGDVTND